MKLRPTHLLLLATITAGMAMPAAAYATPDPAGAPVPLSPVAVGLTSEQHLVTFSVARPWELTEIGAITGLDGDTRIVGIDYRVQDSTLYGLGDEGGVYTFAGAVATQVSQLTVPLEGTAWGVDFNPAADLLRIVSDTGQNLTQDLATDTTVVDADLTYPPSTTPATGISAIAYTNNDTTGTTGTTLYDIDTNLDQTAIQSPDDMGLLVPVGQLGVDAAADAGFDIRSTLADGTAVDATGYATLSVDGRYTLYNINLDNGAATRLGGFPQGNPVTDLAVQLG